MAEVLVSFTIDKPDGSVANIVLGPNADEILLEFNENGEATVELNGKRDYPFEWEFVGDNEESLTVRWRGDGLGGTLIDGFKIDKSRHDTRPWPGGKWKGIGFSTFLRIEP